MRRQEHLSANFRRLNGEQSEKTDADEYEEDPASLDEGDALFQNEDPVTIMGTAFALGLAIEFSFIFVAGVLFSDDTRLKRGELLLSGMSSFAVMVAIFCLFLILRCIALCCVLRNQRLSSSSLQHLAPASKQILRRAIFFCKLPFLFYMPFLTHVYVSECNYTIFDRPLYISTGETTHFSDHLVVCDSRSQWLLERVRPSTLMSVLQTASTIGLPVLFAYLLVKLSVSVWDLDLTDRKHRTYLQLAMLHLVDCIAFITVSFEKSTFVFFQHDFLWKRINMAVFVVGYLATLLQLTLIAPATRATNVLSVVASAMCGGGIGHGGLPERVCSGSMFFLVDLPFLVVRVFLITFAKADAGYLFLIKNVICGVNGFAILCAGTSTNAFSIRIQGLIGLLPGTSEVGKQSGKQYFHDLEEREKDLKREKSSLKEKLNLIEAVDAVKKAIRTRETADVRSVFHSFDFDASGTINGEELQRLFDMTDAQKYGFDSEGFINTLSAQGLLDKPKNIQDVVTAFNRQCATMKEQDTRARHANSNQVPSTGHSKFNTVPHTPVPHSTV